MENISGKPITMTEEAAHVIKNPPPCRAFMDFAVLELDEERFLKASFPVKPEYCNRSGAMQGGFITAAFDNTFGPLGRIYTQTYATTLCLNTNYHAPIYPPDKLIVSVEIMKCGQAILNMRGEAHNQAGKLIATANATCMILNSKNK